MTQKRGETNLGASQKDHLMNTAKVEPVRDGGELEEVAVADRFAKINITRASLARR